MVTLHIDRAALADFLKIPHDPLDKVTLPDRVRNATRVLVSSVRGNRKALKVFVIDPTATPGRIWGCIHDRLLLEFTRSEIEARTWRTLWLRRTPRVRLSVVSLTLLPVRPL